MDLSLTIHEDKKRIRIQLQIQVSQSPSPPFRRFPNFMLGPRSLTAASAISNLGTRSKERKGVRVEETETKTLSLGFVNGLCNQRNLGKVPLKGKELHFLPTVAVLFSPHTSPPQPVSIPKFGNVWVLVQLIHRPAWAKISCTTTE